MSCMHAIARHNLPIAAQQLKRVHTFVLATAGSLWHNGLEELRGQVALLGVSPGCWDSFAWDRALVGRVGIGRGKHSSTRLDTSLHTSFMHLFSPL